MRVIVLSDSHGRFDLLKRAAQQYPADLVIHLGDHAADAVRLQKEIATPVEYVRGNCDAFGPPEEKLIQVGGKKLLITHGHRYHVKSGVGELSLRMKELGAHAALYGHTHIPGYMFHNGGLLLCPGAICGNRTNRESGFAVLEWNVGGQIYVQMTELL